MIIIADICLVLTLAKHHAKHFSCIISLNPYTILFNTQSYLNPLLTLMQPKFEPTTICKCNENVASIAL